ncbi:MAG: ribosomal L7Ae/L30e/S12e/Gadd45 family protein [Clostridia bacterium]|nr:ribosomal L7Ae/L30e/S12e/Gadd45 family protein [Clostridia bacterium]
MPIDQDAFFSMLGIAMRAGQLTLGADGVHAAIAAREAGFVLLDAGASENTKKRLRDACAHYGAVLAETADDRLGFAIGKPGRMCAAVKKGTLCDKLKALSESGSSGRM